MIYKILVIAIGFLSGKLINIFSKRVPSLFNIDPSFKESCYKKSGVRDPTVILTVGFLFEKIYLNYGFSVVFFKYIVLLSFLILIAIIDWDTSDVYICTTWTGIGISLLFLIYYWITGHAVLYYLISGVIAFLIPAIFALFGGMGWGDTEIFLMVGLNVGLFLLIKIIAISFILGGIFSLFSFSIKNIRRGEFYPFGPFIALATILVLSFETQEFLSSMCFLF